VLLALLIQSTVIAKVVASPTDLKLVDDSGNVTKTIPGAWSLQDWSPSGNAIAAIRNGDLFQLPEEKKIGSNVISSKFAGERLLYLTKSGLSERGELLVPKATDFAVKPDGTRMAAVVGGRIFLLDADGHFPRPLTRKEPAESVRWSLDGRWLAVLGKGRLTLMHPNGTAAQDLGEIQGNAVSWSPGGPQLWARRSDAWGIYDLQKREWFRISGEATPRPQWSGPGRLVVRQGNRMVESSISGENETIAPDAAGAMIRPSGFVGGAFPDPFRRSSPPRGSDSAFFGTLIAADPLESTITIAIDREQSARGRERIFVVPEVRTYKFRGKEAELKGFMPESEVRLVGSATDIRQIQTAAEAEIDNALATETRSNRGRTRNNNDRVNNAPKRTQDSDGVSMDRVVVPMTYPILGTKHRVTDTFLASRENGLRRHHGQDLMAPKMTPLLAVFDGIVWFSDRGTSSLSLDGFNGFSADYLHINNDTPGTDDGKGERRYAFPMDLVPGQAVRAGQIIAYCGDSGNAENRGAHLHFELSDRAGGGAILNAIYSLRAARQLKDPVYVDPSPTLAPSGGQVRWDGVIADYNRQKGSVALDLTATRRPGKSAQAQLGPKRVYVTVSSSQVVRLAGDIDIPYGPEALRPGLRLSVVGTPAAGKLAAATMVVSFPPSGR
jgi:murein DD-endopeptidase MepM/ murein hydrolase activator NlpD